MSFTVWKSVLRYTQQQTVRMPAGAEILHVALQNGVPNIWYRCDPNQPMEDRRIAIVPTGKASPDPSEGRYIGTLIYVNGAIHHYFDYIA
jgi:hypothetical protein